MRTEIQQMKKEQSSISMMDEFARYARLDRKINKTTDKLKTHGERSTDELITNLGRTEKIFAVSLTLKSLKR